MRSFLPDGTEPGTETETGAEAGFAFGAETRIEIGFRFHRQRTIGPTSLLATKQRSRSSKRRYTFSIPGKVGDGRQAG